jgi:hypothetical protein
VLGVICNGPHVLVGVGEVGAHEAIGVRNRALLSKSFPDGVRVFGPTLIEMIEIGCPIGSRWPCAHRCAPNSSASCPKPRPPRHPLVTGRRCAMA